MPLVLNLIAAAILVAPGLSYAAADLDTLLAKPILEADLPLVEVQVYTATHVPPMPPIGSPEQWRRESEVLRGKVLDDVVFRGEARNWRNANGRVELLDTISTGKGYRIRKLRYEAVPGL